MEIDVGGILTGKVSGLAPFGAFIDLGEKTTGLVHISEVSSDYIEDLSKHLTVGQEVKVKVVSNENGKIGLSIKRASEDGLKKKRPEKKRSPERVGAPEEVTFGRKTEGMSFDDMMLKFKQDSDERMSDLKRNTEGKRGGGGSRR